MPARRALWAPLALAFTACAREPEPILQPLLAARTLGLQHLERDELPQAEAEFRKFVALAPEAAFGYASLALVQLRRSAFSEAEAEARSALARDSSDPDLQLLLARIYQRSGRADSARVMLRALLDRHPANAGALYAFAGLLRETADSLGPDRAAALERLVELLPANPALRLELAGFRLAQDGADPALQQLELFRQLAPEPPEEAEPALRETLRALRAGRMADARAGYARFRRLIELTPSHQAGLAAVQGPGEPRAGLTELSFASRHAILQHLEHGRAAGADAVRFEDVTRAAGLAGTAALLALGDYDGDGSADLLTSVGLFRSTPQGYQERARESGLSLPAALAAAAFGDFDNDGYLDLYLAEPDGRGRLYRNTGRAAFREVSAAALPDTPEPRAAHFADLDHDGDLDLLVLSARGSRLLRNNLDGSFADVSQQSGIAGLAATAGELGDFDADGLLDLLLLDSGRGVRLLRNTGPGRFSDASDRAGLSPQPGVTALAAADYDNDGDFDLLLSTAGGLYQNDGAGRFQRDARSDAVLRGTGLRAGAARFFDYDNDGWLDLLLAGDPAGGAGAALLRNVGGRLQDRSELLPSGLGSVTALAVWDYGQDGDLDLLAAGAAGLRLLQNEGGNLNLWMRVTLTGLRTGSGKNNRFGTGARVTLRAGELLQAQLVTSGTVHFGLGRHLKADVLRIEWPNGVPQLIYLPGSDQDVLETQVLKGSCAFLYAWDGERYRFITDLMWRSALGMPVGIMASGGTAYAPSHASREYLKLPAVALAPRDGHYALRLTEELWETAYLDRLRLIAVDHPDSVELFVNERFVPPGPVEDSLRLYQLVRRRAPRAASDGDGNDVLPLLAARDDRYLGGFEAARYQGLVEPHDLLLDLGGGIGAGTVLGLTGWIFPTDASINVALSQGRGAEILPPSLEVLDARGRWRTVSADLGFPSGKDKTVLAELGGKLRPGEHRLRIRTNLQIYWDQVFLADAVEGVVRQTTLTPASADLRARGFSRGYRKGGRYGPHWFDYDSVSVVSPWRPIAGPFTRWGDVLPLLEAADDRYVVMAPGDEARVEFPVAALPPLPAGWTRDFLVYTVGWIKDADLHTAHGGSVEPLPFHAMRRYPYGAGEAYPGDAVHRDYLRNYQTRPASDRGRGSGW